MKTIHAIVMSKILKGMKICIFYLYICYLDLPGLSKLGRYTLDGRKSEGRFAADSVLLFSKLLRKHVYV